jgi:hypothetical protein
MKILVLTYAEVEQLLPMRECIAVMEEALRALARGELSGTDGYDADLQVW